MRLLRAYRLLNRQERRELLAALWRLAVIRISLLFGIERTRKRFSGRKNKSLRPLAKTEQPAWEARAKALRRATSALPGAACLARSLALRWWMRSEGIQADCQIGVKRSAGQIESHAWVECSGQPIAEEQDVTALYKPVRFTDHTANLADKQGSEC